MMQVMEEYGPGHDAMARRIKDRLTGMARKRREQAAAHRTAIVVAEAQPERVVFDTPHGRAYRVEKSEGISLMASGGSKQSITLPYVSILDR